MAIESCCGSAARARPTLEGSGAMDWSSGAGSDLSSSEAVSPYWRHAAMMNAPRVFWPVRITPLLNSAVTDATLRQRGVDDLEVQRLPQGVSPSWVTRDQLARIETIMRDQPEPAAALSGVGGGQFAPPTENQKVERAAMQAVTDFYERGGWTVDDVSMAKVGWDIPALVGVRSAESRLRGSAVNDRSSS